MEAKKLCFNWIQVLFCSDQSFLDFGKDIHERDLTYLDAVLFVPVAHTLFYHIPRRRKN